MEVRCDKTINIYDIAALARVSTATVSKVINGKDGVSEKTRKKVQEIVNIQGFTPKISVNQPNYIAVLYNNLNTDVFDSDFTRKVLKGISDAIYNTDCYLTLLPFKAVPKDRDEFLVFCHRQRINGCIFLDLKRTDDFIYRIVGGVPMVVINEDIKAENVYSVISTDFLGAYQAVMHLIENGHRRIAMAGADSTFRSHSQRLDAYKKALENHNVPVEKGYMFDLTVDGISGFEPIWKKWEMENRLPTAIFTRDDKSALLIIDYLSQMGKSVPEDISIIGFDDYDYGRIITPKLTTVKQKLYEKGQKAVELIFSSIEGRISYSEENYQYVYETELVIRGSVKKIN